MIDPQPGAALQEPWLLYDGACPFCTRYVKLVRLRDAMQQLRLVDAREGGNELKKVIDAQLCIDDGMVLGMHGRLYHGAECMNMLAMMSTPVGVFNRFNSWIFSSPTRSSFMYPVLRACRNLVLRVLGRPKIDTDSSGHDHRLG